MPRPPLNPVDVARRAALLRRAGDLIGSEELARLLSISSRNLYQMMAGDRGIRDGILTDARKLLIQRRQMIHDLVQDIRVEEAAGQEVAP